MMKLNPKLPLAVFLLLASCFNQSCFIQLTLAAKPNSRPNIVYIMADDLGYGDIKSFGLERCQIATPGFDQLAKEGMRFTDAHSIASVCVPSRVGIMTGRYDWRFSRPQPDGPWGFLNPRLATDQFTLGIMLKSVGYKTAYVGKWHLGTLMQTTDRKNQGARNVDYTKPLEIGPPQYGFDHSFILPASLDMYPYAFVKNNMWIGKVTAQKGWSAFNRVGPAAEDFEDVKVLDTFSTEAERFISENAQAASKRDKPFFLYVALTAPHTPVSPRNEFQGKSKLGIYGDFVMETDDCVARVVKALKDNGLYENTLVIATSDHGAAPYAGRTAKATAAQNQELQKEGHYSSGPFRGYKFSVYEGGFRVSYAVRWPGVVPPRTECNRLVGLHDLMATVAEIVGYELKDDQGPDSISLLSLFKNPKAKPPRKSMILHATPSFGIRHGNWKLALCPGSGCGGGLGNSPPRKVAWKQARETFGRAPKSHDELRQAPFVQLFNLKEDISESNNLAADNPERVQDMLAIFEEQIAQGRSTPGPQLKNDVPTVNPFPSVPEFVF